MSNRVLDAYERHQPVKSYLINWYAKLLDKMLPPESVVQLVEFGILPPSAKFWHELYPNARIIAVDISRNKLPDYCEFIHGCYNTPKVVEAVRYWGKYQLMVDDANHELRYQKEGLEFYWPMLAVGGLYIIEDIISKASFDSIMELATTKTSAYEVRHDPKGHGEGGEFVLFLQKEKKDDDTTVQNQGS